MEFRNGFQKKLVFLMKENGFTQKQLAERLGVQPQTVSLWMKGKTNPDILHFSIMCSIFGVSADWFLCRDSHDFEHSEAMEHAIRLKTILDGKTVDAIEKLDEESLHLLKLFLKSVTKNRGGE